MGIGRLTESKENELMKKKNQQLNDQIQYLEDKIKVLEEKETNIHKPFSSDILKCMFSQVNYIDHIHK